MMSHDRPAPSPAPVPVRDERVGGYLLIRQLANGGMAVVYEAAHTVLPRRAALKVLHRDLLAVDGSAERLLQEACILETFRHPGVVQVYDSGVLPDGRPWLAMELVTGATLATRLARSGPITPGDLVDLLRAIAEVLAAAHDHGVVHRDLKPENVLVEGPGFTRVRLIDWGIAWREPVGASAGTGDTTLGTPTYMAPEQARGLRVDGRCDVYALGIVAYEALTGAPPFSGTGAVDVMMKQLTATPQPLRELRPDLPRPLIALCEQMLAKDPRDRPTAAALVETLTALAEQDYDELRVEEDGACDELGPIGALGATVADDYDELTVEDDEDEDEDADATDDEEPILLELRLGQPRWTPQGLVASARPVLRVVRPGPRDEAAGEIDTDA